MASEWQTLSLAEVYDFSSGLSKPRSEFGSGHPFLSFKDVFYNSAVPKQLTELVQSTEQERERCSVMRGDVFLTRTSETMDELGMSSVALADIPDATFNGFTKRLRPKRELVAPGFARYFFRSSDFRAAVNSMSTMSTRASLNNEMLERLTIRFPGYVEQEAIAHILGTLDDKIELNRKQNETLEAMARALFKAWFVDFEPVRAKLEGRWQRDQSRPGLPAHLYSLFPDRLVKSELGEIPEGWSHDRLATFTGIKNGYAFRSKDWQANGVPVVKIGSVKPQFVDVQQVSFISYTLAQEKKQFRLSAGDMLVGLTGYVGETGRVPIVDVYPMLNQRVGKFEPKTESAPFVFANVRAAEFKVFAESRAHGSAQPNISTADLLTYPVINPDKKILAAFCNYIAPFFDQQLRCECESRFLAQLRDTLLPKLISGELQVMDAKMIAKKVL